MPPAKSQIGKIAKQLSKTEGVVLRYVVMTIALPIEPEGVINHIDWSPLPHSYLESKKTFDSLTEKGLIKRRQSAPGFMPTKLGKQVLNYGNAHNMWQRPLVQPADSRTYK